MSKIQSNQNEKPLAERSAIEVKPGTDELNRVIRYRDNLKLIPEILEYDERGRKLRQEVTRLDNYIWKYQNGFTL